MLSTVEQAAYTPPAALLKKVRETLNDAVAASTENNYATGWADFAAWCAANAAPSLPTTAEVVVCYLQDRAASRRVGTALLYLRAIAVHHRRTHHPDPTATELVATFVTGLRRRAANEGQSPRKMAALRTVALRQTVTALPDRLLGVRDRALLLLGFAGAFRRGELVALDVRDLAFGERGLAITVRRSKTDQFGEGKTLAIPFTGTVSCPVVALKAWLAAAKIADGPVFRYVDRHGRVHPKRLSAQTVRLVVRRSVAAIGLEADGYGAHSLRRGYATSAAEGGTDERTIMAHGRWVSVTTCRGYIAEGELFRTNALAGTGL